MSIPSNKTLERLLDYTALNQKAIGQNIANAETKNYKRKEVDFKDLLDNGMKKLSDEQSGGSEFEIKIDEESAVNSQGNNVNISREMAEMAKNTIMFKFAAKNLSSYFQTLQGVIKGGS